MPEYGNKVIVLSILVNGCLLAGTNRIAGFPGAPLRTCLAAILGGIYSGLCLMPSLLFLGGLGWRLLCLVAMSIVAFGWEASTLRRGVLFVLLCMALGGVAGSLEEGAYYRVPLAAVTVVILCAVGFHGKAGQRVLVPVTLRYGNTCLRIRALYDTGNTLTDPVTGEGVLVVGADVGKTLLGLSAEQLADPVATAYAAPVPGLRLIPCRSVGNSRGLLLGLRISGVQIGKRTASALVAFAPIGLDCEGTYQALTGGLL